MRVSLARSPDVAAVASHISSSTIKLAFIDVVDDAIFLHIVIISHTYQLLCNIF